MNKRIYCRDKFIEFTNSPPQAQQNEAFIHFYKNPNSSQLSEISSLIVDEKDPENIFVSETDFEKVFTHLKTEFKYIEAAGGFIEKKAQFLCIHRLGRWDLPKGKLEKGETVKQGAIRECMEECGIRSLNIIKTLQSTFHIYPFKSHYAIKQSFWFYMISDDEQKLVPQIEENIDEVRWFTKEEILKSVIKDTYYTIADVLTEALTL